MMRSSRAYSPVRASSVSSASSAAFRERRTGPTVGKSVTPKESLHSRARGKGVGEESSDSFPLPHTLPVEPVLAGDVEEVVADPIDVIVGRWRGHDAHEVGSVVDAADA